MKKNREWIAYWLGYYVRENMKNNTKTTNKTTAVNLITNSKGKFFTVTFVKKNGTTRTINGNYKQPKKPNPLGYLNVYSMSDKGYRNINPTTIKAVSINNTTYTVK